MNLIEGIQKEADRAREILNMYEEIPQGAFGAMMIKQTLKKADSVIASGDVVEMLVVYKELQEIK